LKVGKEGRRNNEVASKKHRNAKAWVA